MNNDFSMKIHTFNSAKLIVSSWWLILQTHGVMNELIVIMIANDVDVKVFDKYIHLFMIHSHTDTTDTPQTKYQRLIFT